MLGDSLSKGLEILADCLYGIVSYRWSEQKLTQ